MCYDVRTKLESMLRRAKHYNNEVLIRELEKMLLPFYQNQYHHVSGYSHPQLLIYTNKQPFKPIASTWGLVPGWIKDVTGKLNIWNKTINARIETIFEKPSFKKAANSQRCIVYVDGFYEHHHKDGKAYPFYIKRKDNEPIALAGLWEEWTDKESGEILNTFTIVTTKANQLMSEIHNNPKLKESRMPLMLSDKQIDTWLHELKHGDRDLIKFLVTSTKDQPLHAHSVRPIRGKNASGNTPQASEPFKYDQLEFDFLE